MQSWNNKLFYSATILVTGGKLVAEQEYITIKELAVILGFNYSTVLRYCQLGVIPCAKIGSRRLIHKSYVQEIRPPSINPPESKKKAKTP